MNTATHTLDGHGGHAAPASAPNQSQSPLADGEVKKVDKAAGKVTVESTESAESIRELIQELGYSAQVSA